MTVHLGAKTTTRDEGWSRDVVVDGVTYVVSLAAHGRYRIAFKPRGTYGSHWYGRVVRRESWAEVWEGRVEKSTGVRGMLIAAGVLPHRCPGSRYICGARVCAADLFGQNGSPSRCDTCEEGDRRAQAAQAIAEAFRALLPRCVAQTDGNACHVVVDCAGDLCATCADTVAKSWYARMTRTRIEVQPRYVGLVVGRLIAAMGGRDA